MKHRQSSLLRTWFIKVYQLLHAYYHTSMGRGEFFLWRDPVFWQKENLVLSFKMKMPRVTGLCCLKWLLNWISPVKDGLKGATSCDFQQHMLLGRMACDWQCMWGYLEISTGKKNRIEEKWGIVRKAKGRGKIEMEITKKMKGNFQGCFLFCEINYSQYMQSSRQYSIGEFRKTCYTSHTEINSIFPEHRNSINSSE